MSIAQHGNMVFVAWYTYDALGRAAWYVIPSCPISGNSCTGVMYSVAGGNPLTTAWNSPQLAITPIGSGTLTWTDNDAGTFNYSVNGVPGSRSITRQVFAPGHNALNTNYSDLWWNSSESGWGMAVTHQFGMVFATIYTYDTNGTPVWYAASSCPVVGISCEGPLYQVTGGSAPTVPWNGAARTVEQVGTISLQFHSTNLATATYSIRGVSGSRVITRQAFGGEGEPVVSFSDVFDAFRAMNGGFRERVNYATDGPPRTSTVCGMAKIEDREAIERLVANAGGTVLTSTPTQWCGTAGGETACLRMFGNVLISDIRAAGYTSIQLNMLGLLSSAMTTVDFDTELDSVAHVASHWRDSTVTDGTTCSTSQPPQPRDVVNGIWSGYKFIYSPTTQTGVSTPSRMSCANQVCTVLTDQSATFALTDSFTWRTGAGAPKLAGVAISSDLQLLSMYLCSAPLDEARAFESCGFFSFRRSQ